MNNDQQYKAGPASVFSTLARLPVTIWAWCAQCWTRTEQDLTRETKLDEVYRCRDCGNEHSVRVR